MSMNSGDNDTWLRDVPEPELRPYYYPSPDDWRQELIYVLMPDRFSDGRDGTRPLLNRAELQHVPPANAPVSVWYWNHWAISGRNRFQGGTLKGIQSRLNYLEDLHVTALWIGPVWKQRAIGTDLNYGDAGDPSIDPYAGPNPADVKPGESDDFVPEFLARDSYHGFDIQDFLEVDARFGTTQDLCDLIEAAHARGIYVILDMVINHTAVNWLYGAPILSPWRPSYPPPAIQTDGRYPFGAWLDAQNEKLTMPSSAASDDAVWPVELQNPDHYTRQGEGNYGSGYFDLKNAEFRTSDYRNRDLKYQGEDPDPVLDLMVRIWSYWIAKTDCDGYRVDTFKHVPFSTAKTFSDQIRAFARTTCKKNDFLVIGEVGGPDAEAATYLQINDVRVLEVDVRRQQLRALAGGDTGIDPENVLRPMAKNLNKGWDFDNNFDDAEKAFLASLPDADVRDRFVMSVDDYDDLGLDPQGRIARVQGEQSLVPAAALMLYGPGIPSLYYGTEQALQGPVGEDGFLNGYGLHDRARGGDRYLREAMFGPEHPRPAGLAGRNNLAAVDPRLPGFGPMGTSGLQVFDQHSPWYLAFSVLAKLRHDHHVLATGDITLLTTGRVDGGRFGADLPAGIVAWARRRDDEVGVVVVSVADRRDAVPRPTPELDLALPEWAVTKGLACWATVSSIGGGMTEPSHRVGVVRRMPQTGLPYLSLGGIPTGQVRVYLP
jgi:glycosidase